MKKHRPDVFPYIPNSAPGVKREMLDYVGANRAGDFFQDVPDKLRLTGLLDLPDRCRSEYELKRHIGQILNSNSSVDENLSFLGAGCYQHHVPAVCDEVNQRSEFLTAYAGEPYDDHGRFQALFEYASMMGDLLEMDVVNVPTYDGFQAAATAIRMAARITGRNEILVGRTVNPSKLSKMRDYCKPDLGIGIIDYMVESGQLDIKHLSTVISDKTAAVYIDNPNYLGVIETGGSQLADIAHNTGALFISGANPITLGVLTPPVGYGADIACGDIQPLGMHMQCGGGQAGFIATADNPRFVMEYPSRLFGIAPTRVPGEYGFGDVAYERTSFAKREGGKEWVGTAAALWGITAGVYLALMGPQGMADIGETIMTRTRYAMQVLQKIPGIEVMFHQSPHFEEFVVNFDRAGMSVNEVNDGLLVHKIVGGKDLAIDYPELGQSAIFSVTEVHGKRDIDRLSEALMEVIE